MTVEQMYGDRVKLRSEGPRIAANDRGLDAKEVRTLTHIDDSTPLPLCELPAAMRARIERLAAAPLPPPQWITLGHGSITSRAFYEWHLRRGRDILHRPLRENIPGALRAQVIARDGYVCGLCGGVVEPTDLHIDHRVPVSRGGPTVAGNLQVAHAACNTRKGNRV